MADETDPSARKRAAQRVRDELIAFVVGAGGNEQCQCPADQSLCICGGLDRLCGAIWRMAAACWQSGQKTPVVNAIRPTVKNPRLRPGPSRGQRGLQRADKRIRDNQTNPLPPKQEGVNNLRVGPAASHVSGEKCAVGKYSKRVANDFG